MKRLVGTLAAAVCVTTVLTTAPGHADGPVLTMTPDLVDFGGQPLNTTSAAQTVTLSNTSATAVGLSGLSITGIDAGLFDLQNDTCSDTLDASTSCTVDVTFTPDAAGQFQATLTVASDAAAPLPTVALTGTGEDHSITIDVTDLAFGDQPVGVTSSPKTITLTNNQTTTRTVTPTLSGPNKNDFSLTDTCSTPLAPGDNCAIDVTFTPSAPGARTASVDISTGDPNQPDQSVALSGTGEDHSITIDGREVAFGYQRVAVASAAQRLTLTNNQTTTRTVTPTLSGPNKNDFSLTDTCSTPLAPGDNCSIDVTFTPSTSGDRFASLTISTGDPFQPKQSLPLTGTGVEPLATVDVTSLAFGDQRVGTTSASRSVEVSNPGSMDLTVSQITVTGAAASAFRVVSDCDQPVRIGRSCTAQVRFDPAMTGNATASLRVISDGSPSPLTVSLDGRGVQPNLSLTPESMAFGGQPLYTTSGERSLTVRNTGTYPLTVGAITVSGAAASAFRVRSSTCGPAVAVGSSCVVRVVFQPDQQGALQATLLIDNDAPGGPRQVPLSGSGMVGRPTLSPKTVDFGLLVSGTNSERNVTLTNTGGAPFVVGALTTTGPHADQFTATGSCNSVAPGQTCDLTVRFNASGDGNRTASLQVITSAGTVTISLTGESRARVILSQEPLGDVWFAKRIVRGRWTPVMALPVRTNAGQYAAITVEPPRRVRVRQYLGKLELLIRGKSKATISVKLYAPATDGFHAYSATKVYRVKAG